MIRFKCPSCKKTLSAKEAQAGRKTACPNCKKAIVVPTPKPKPVPDVDMDALAAEMLGEGAAKQPVPEPVAAKTIKFNCEFCDGPIEVPFSEAGSKMPCPDPECRRIVRVPVPADDKPKDWRDIIKKGPSAAMINQPEQLENAWGTEQKSRVSSSAMQEAGAVREVVVPVGIGVWIKRAFWSAALVGAIVLAVSGVRRNRTERQERDAIDEAVASTVGNQSAKIKLSATGLAEIHRAAGELFCAKRKAAKARDHFRKALDMLQRADSSAAPLDVDMLLIELALAQIELGGTETEMIAKEKLEWPDLQKDIGKSLEAISAEPVRVMAVRLVSSRLWEKKQSGLAISLAGQASSKNDAPGQPSLMVAQLVALLLARKDKEDETQAGKLLPRPSMEKEKAVIDPIARIAYVEGLARQGKFKDALDLAMAKSTPVQLLESQQRMEACVGAAAVILADRSLPKPATEALPFVKEALLAHRELLKENKKYQIPPWLLFQLAQAGAGCESPKEEEECKGLAKTLDLDLAQYYKLACLRLQWAKANAPISEPTVDMEKDALPFSLAWESVARLNSRYGMSRDDVLKMTTEERLSPFLLAGFALGKHDRDK